MRNVPVISDTFYHVYNRGNLRQELFRDRSDYVRFVFLILYLQSTLSLTQTNRSVSNYIKKGSFGVSKGDLAEILEQRFVEVHNFCIMPNHFHMTIKNLTDDGLSRYMHKIANAYGKYFNTKYDQSGHVFQGTYKTIIIETDNQLDYLSAYVHRNPHELSKWKDNAFDYPWSSYQDYDNNRWGSLLCVDQIKNRHKSFADYRKFVEESGAKEGFS